MTKDMDVPCVLGFDEVFEDGCIVGSVDITNPMSMDAVDELMKTVLEKQK